jgi:NitT/TauT family transport system permease protein
MRKAYIFMVLSLFIGWVGVIVIFNPPSFLIPPPTLVFKVLWEERADFVYHTGITISGAVVGYAIANVIAIAMAISFVYFKRLEEFTTPWMVVIKNVPFVTIASILVITLGDTPLPKIIIVVLITFFPILANVVKGLRSPDSVLLDRMKTLSATTWQVFWKVRWPFALPYYIASHEIAATGSIIGAIVAEFLFAREGLGFLIVRSTMQYRTDRLYGVTLIASVLSVGVYIVVKSIETRMLRYKKEIST